MEEFDKSDKNSGLYPCLKNDELASSKSEPDTYADDITLFVKACDFAGNEFD